MTNQSFYQWIKTQKDNESIEDLAGDVLADTTFPKKSKNYIEIEEYMEREGACDEALEEFRSAWEQYLGNVTFYLVEADLNGKRVEIQFDGITEAYDFCKAAQESSNLICFAVRGQ